MTPRTEASGSDRTLRSVSDLDTLRFDENGRVPVVAQDHQSGAVLMVAWATREALERTLESGEMHYWSRSRSELWRKGETSGNIQQVISLHTDCDRDTVLARVTMEGPACHTGETTCFGSVGAPWVTTGDSEAVEGVLSALVQLLEDRDRDRPEGSYTTRLLSDENLRLKKLGEETVELVVALVRRDTRAPEEAADLLYHLLVALQGAGVPWASVLAELDRRRG
jgi:phosphoribosyl-AMP cyclohydrolase / phosphoribosyl-ATP pyrophosphohydrolase